MNDENDEKRHFAGRDYGNCCFGNDCAGDGKAKVELRILCLVPGNNPQPAEYGPVFDWMPFTTSYSKDWNFYYGWIKDFVAVTGPMKGSDITSKADGDKKCKDFFAAQREDDKVTLKYPDAAANARMAEHHENGVGGWSFGAMIHPGTAAKSHLKHGVFKGAHFWTAINDQPANPWDP